MQDVEVIERAEAAAAALDPVRARLLSELAVPASAAGLAVRVGIARQKVNYHLKALEAHGLPIVEDACEALGAEYQGRPLGSRGAPAVFAFYPNKQMATGEGGVVTTHSEEEWRMLKSLRNQGRGDTDGEYADRQRGN